MTNWPNFGNMTREEAIKWFRDQEDERLVPLIRWVAESAVMAGCYQEVRIALAESERLATRKAKGEDSITPEQWERRGLEAEKQGLEVTVIGRAGKLRKPPGSGKR